MPNQIPRFHDLAVTSDVDGVHVTRNSSDGRTDRGTNNKYTQTFL